MQVVAIQTAYLIPTQAITQEWRGSMYQYDTDYYQARAEQEIECAQKAEVAEAARAHYLLAGYYLDRIYNVPSPPEKPASPFGTKSVSFVRS
jgi:hypothetical protein